MDPTFFIQKNHSGQIAAHLTPLSPNWLDAIVTLQTQVLATITNKQTFVPSSPEEILEGLVIENAVWGVVTENKQLVAVGIYKNVGDAPDNYGYDFGLSAFETTFVGHVDTTIVAPDYRGNGLQKKLILQLEAIAKQEGLTIMCATVSPENPYSLKTFLNLNYEIKADKLKYGGVRRYVLAKTLN